MINFDAEDCQNLETALRREWLETNNLGGFASSTITDANTRRYHGLLTAALRPPTGRVVLLSKFEAPPTLAARAADRPGPPRAPLARAAPARPPPADRARRAALEIRGDAHSRRRALRPLHQSLRTGRGSPARVRATGQLPARPVPSLHLSGRRGSRRA